MIITRLECGWCGKNLDNESVAEHALLCTAQPYQIFRKNLLAEMTREADQVTVNGKVPIWISKAIFKAEEQTAQTMRRNPWN